MDGSFASQPLPDDRELFLAQLRVYLAAMYPGCPEDWRKRLLDRARKGGHYGRLGEIAGILTDTSVRHQATDYDRLLRVNGRGEGLTREEARMVVDSEVRDIISSWREGSAECSAAYRELLRGLRKRRRKKGDRRNNPAVVGNENAVIAEFLLGWLRHGDRLSSPKNAINAGPPNTERPSDL